MNGNDGLTCSSGSELYITSLHAKKLFSLFAFRALLDHAVTVSELATQNVTEDFGIAMRMRREASSRGDTIFVQNSKTAEVLKAAVKVASETECMVGVQPAMIRVSALSGAAKNNLSVGKRL